MFELPTTAGAATCAAIAQILPVFMVALVAERIVKLREPASLRARAKLMLATTIRILVDASLVISLLALTLSALIGIERDGLSGRAATGLWVGTMLIGVAILYRWLLISTPLLSLMNEANRVWVRLVLDSAEALGRAWPQWLSRLSNGISRALLVVTELIFGVITVGMFNGALSFSDWLAARILRPRDRKSPDDASEDNG